MEVREKGGREVKDIVFFDVKNYEIIINSSYVKFKVENIEIWDEISTFISQILCFLK